MDNEHGETRVLFLETAAYSVVTRITTTGTDAAVITNRISGESEAIGLVRLFVHVFVCFYTNL